MEEVIQEHVPLVFVARVVVGLLILDKEELRLQIGLLLQEVVEEEAPTVLQELEVERLVEMLLQVAMGVLPHMQQEERKLQEGHLAHPMELVVLALLFREEAQALVEMVSDLLSAVIAETQVAVVVVDIMAVAEVSLILTVGEGQVQFLQEELLLVVFKVAMGK